MATTTHGCDCDQPENPDRLAHARDCFWRLASKLVQQCQSDGLSFQEAVVQLERIWTEYDNER